MGCFSSVGCGRHQLDGSPRPTIRYSVLQRYRYTRAPFKINCRWSIKQTHVTSNASMFTGGRLNVWGVCTKCVSCRNHAACFHHLSPSHRSLSSFLGTGLGILQRCKIAQHTHTQTVVVPCVIQSMRGLAITHQNYPSKFVHFVH